MKNFKVTMLAIVAALGLSSCFGDPDPNVTTQEIVKVNNTYGMSFKSAGGYDIIPLNPMDVITLKGPYTQVAYQYNRDEVVYPVKEVKAKILAAEDVPELFVIPEAGIEENSPMASVMLGASSGVMFYDKDNIFIPLSFYYRASSDATAQKEEVNSHSFELYPIANDDSNTENLTLRLVHHVGDPSKDSERRNIGTLLHHVNLTSALAGRIPEKVIIKFTQAGNDATLENASKNLGSFEIAYKKIYEDYYKPKN